MLYCCFEVYKVDFGIVNQQNTAQEQQVSKLACRGTLASWMISSGYALPSPEKENCKN